MNVSLALLWQFGFDGVGEEFVTVGASPGWRPCEEVGLCRKFCTRAKRRGRTSEIYAARA